MSKLILTSDTHTKITDYVRLIDAEIGMFGYVTLNDGDFIVDHVFLVEQTVSGSSVDFADTGLDYAIQQAIKDDRIADLKFCCHSHVDMDAFWSSTDESMIAGMNNGMTPYIVSLVINKRHETQQRVDFFNPPGEIGQFTSQLTFDLDLEISTTNDKARLDEIAALVTNRPTYYHPPDRRPHRPSSEWFVPSPQLPVPNSAGDIIGYRDPTEDELSLLESFAIDADYYSADTAALVDMLDDDSKETK